MSPAFMDIAVCPDDGMRKERASHASLAGHRLNGQERPLPLVLCVSSVSGLEDPEFWEVVAEVAGIAGDPSTAI